MPERATGIGLFLLAVLGWLALVGLVTSIGPEDFGARLLFFVFLGLALFPTLTLAIRFAVPWLGQGKLLRSASQGALGSIIVVLAAMLQSARSLDLLTIPLLIGLLVTAEFLLLARS